jgi:uncharacterized protein with FMN-binding domain
MKKFKINKILRIIVQILFFIFLPGLVGMAFSEVKILFTDLFNANFINILTDCTLFIVLALSTMILGRFFCGWMCMFGTYNDLINLIGKRIFKINFQPNEKVDEILKYFKYLVLIFIGFFVWTAIITIPEGSSPWDALVQLTNPGYAFNNYLIGLIILFIITIGDLFIERFFCRYLCPLGAIFSLLAKARILNIKKDKQYCGPCKACTLKCAMGINLDKVNLVRSGECINCLNCTSICPKHNAKMVINNKVINEYAIATLAVAGTTGSYLGSDKIVQNYFSTSETSSQTSSKYADGTYTGTGTGYRPNLKVSVTIKNGKITSITLISTNDTNQFFNKAWGTIQSKIMSSQSTNVSTVSGATYSSKGIIEAVNNALDQAIAAKSNVTENDNTNSTSNQESSSSSTTNSSTNNSTNSSNNTTNNGSTNTSSSDNSNTTTTTSKKYKNGTYSGSAQGYSGTVTVNVTISNNKITSITLVSESDSPRQWSSAWSTIVNKIINNNSTNVNTVSGATYSSKGIINAVSNALTKATY